MSDDATEVATRLSAILSELDAIQHRISVALRTLAASSNRATVRHTTPPQ